MKISDAWINAVDKGTLHEDQKLKSLDLLILLQLHDLPNRRKPVEGVLKNKIRAGKVTQDLIKKCFKDHAKVIRTQFESVQNLAEMLMNAQEKILNHFSTILHVQAFANLDRYCQQEVISDLATQIGTNPKTKDIALTTLAELAVQYTSLLANFSHYISGK